MEERRIDRHLYERRYQTSSGEWSRCLYARFTDWKGVRRVFPLGTDLRTARERLKALEGDNVHKVDFDKEKRPQRITFNQWADRYLTLSKEKRTLQDDRYLLRFLREEFGPMPLEEITYARVKEFSLRLLSTPTKQHPDRPPTPATCNRKLALLRHILRMAWKEGLIEKLPAVELFPENNERDRVLTEEEFQQLHNQAASHLQPILLCAWETGMRRGEILALTWPKVDLKRNLIILDSRDTKTGRKRPVPVSPRLREILLSLRQTRVTALHQHVFTFPDGRPIKNIQESFDNAVKRAGLTDLHFHDLRRSFATRKIMEGWDRDYVKAITGHRTDKVFSRYNRPSEEILQAVVSGPPSARIFPHSAHTDPGRFCTGVLTN